MCCSEHASLRANCTRVWYIFLENLANNKVQYLFKLDSATALRKRLIVLMGISPVHCSFFILLTLTAIIQ